MSKRMVYALLVTVLTLSACNVQFPVAKTPGPDVTTDISVDAPKADQVNLTLAFGAGKMTVSGGAEGKLVSGAATYNVPDLKPNVITNGSDIRVEEGDYQLNGTPILSGIKNEWVLKLGNMPINLTVSSGAYDGTFDFGGLSLTNLSINDGAAQTELDFSSPNQSQMSILSYKTGASNVTLKELANANAATVLFESGAGNYKLDFSGKLQRDVSATIRAGMSNLTLFIPAGVPTTVKVSSGLSNVQFADGWSQNGDTYSQTGSGPELTIVVEMGAGNLQISQ